MKLNACQLVYKKLYQLECPPPGLLNNMEFNACQLVYLNVSDESGNVTIAGSPSTDELVFFQVMRDVSADNQSGDARLLGIKLFFTTDAKNDA